MKIAAVTGASRGIGFETAKRLAGDGFFVNLLGRDFEALSCSARRILDSCPQASVDCQVIDVSDPDSVKSAFQSIFAKHKGLDVLVCNAGVLEDALIGMVSTDQIRRVFAANVYGVLFCCQYGSRLINRRGGGSIINVSSIIGTNGNVGQSVYGGSKAAVIGVTKSLAKELAPSNIRVNAVAPGFIDTDMARSISDEKFQERLSSIKMKRIGKPEEVASVISFLAGDDSTYVTGQVIGVDGGMLI
jgi:3-oxoacyl-[acyl-carrier protein] reductase